MNQSFKEKVLACEYLCGTHAALPDVVLAEIMASTGFDFVWIDTEHSPLNYEALLLQIGAVQSAGAAAVVRLSMDDRNHTKRVLEMGPDGVVFPMINTPEEADAAMRSCMYPPEGIRGFGPMRATRYGLVDEKEYIRTANERLCRFIQIETEEAVKNLPEIIKNPYIDGYIFGPCDLSGSIGRLGDVFGEETTALIRESIAILKAAGKCIGVSTGSTDPKVIRYWKELGINLISSGTDYRYLLDACLENCKNIRGVFAE
ncbi:MAG: aldolase [Ruminococcaceae bacterium]|nr:aldolase [Oscillospiraceae bacterium]